MVSTRVTKYELMEETAHQKLIIKVVEEGFLCYPWYDANELHNQLEYGLS